MPSKHRTSFDEVLEVLAAVMGILERSGELDYDGHDFECAGEACPVCRAREILTEAGHIA